MSLAGSRIELCCAEGYNPVETVLWSDTVAFVALEA